ncbi:MAG: tRNA (N6-isopentenyl adenosine(37)-C2)-methylthiotransferase MiaB [Polynucleobacter sp. 24-46-87]|jgi:tRNA-2-methylthio-N6-dimethylallyladenosine synthase|uniref:tRNA (N6-isopentenyl adenosine(37)-C2)-methylthiotransferase MiaB n=1 Tax=unclassified Polynucleobacter TaxID=2640945 RepID=UPI000BC88433|nr:MULTISPECIES: tRNA (N6-isopentenyl adenosine(37)-C2)-methylthiotransferase MiaB [unclassified Polynucleobacter]OYY20945.1 MAG: tRNA (N6-isopentenyl adenosine(37)-C2)-methylthiotransferase MiaB [Polynucleobacter sp. 35-46-11]OZA13839.1 MAG: tRNA (N6-isopentenyl adenosine(37)-C2)-methylthiotransferase MiaB [Polynucleobacter sp. 24-46-87]OZA77989.1 MAG: tRNA (N6-isopentenyl adenosine(37)-C2)-methylthiotransferase MiaB [Polynucleobacter sp. 39-46-10]
MKKLYIKTFGCQMNEYDSGKMADLLHADEGMVMTDTPEDADVVLLNTCSIREKAEDKVFSDLGRLRELKKTKPNLLIGVGGCVASQEGQQIISRAPYVDVVFGPQTLHRLSDLIAQRRQTGRSQVDISFPEIEKFDHLPASRQTRGSAYVSIMEGCSKYCSYCVVPYTRGEEISRPFDDVLTEVAGLAAQGVKEIVLLGQNVNAYLGKMGGNEEIADFALLIEYIAEIPGVERIRFTTSHPKEFTQRLIDIYAKVPKLVSHLHLPVQHASDSVLSAMKRGYTALEYKSIIRKMRAVRPDLTLSSDFIVGFPGETDEDFAKLLKMVEELNFDNSFCFIFSARPGTPAANLSDDTPYEVKLKRLQTLLALVESQANQISKNMLGNTERVLVEGLAKDGVNLQGRAANNRVIHFTAPNDDIESLIGQMVDIRITEVLNYTLRGELIGDLTLSHTH